MVNICEATAAITNFCIVSVKKTAFKNSMIFAFFFWFLYANWKRNSTLSKCEIKYKIDGKLFVNFLAFGTNHWISLTRRKYFEKLEQEKKLWYSIVKWKKKKICRESWNLSTNPTTFESARRRLGNSYLCHFFRDHWNLAGRRGWHRYQQLCS